MNLLKAWIWVPACLLSMPLSVWSQAPFVFRVTQGQTNTSASDGDTVTFSAPSIGQSSSANVTVTYQGSSATVTSIDLTGSSDFSLSSLPKVPFPLTAQQSFSFGVRFLPRTATRASGRIAIKFTEAANTGTLTLNLLGLAPDVLTSYIVQPEGNTTPVAGGGTITFPLTVVDNTSSVLFIVGNRGSGPAVVKSLAITGADFRISGAPLLPATLDPGGEVRFVVSFAPKQRQTSKGSLRVELSDRTDTFNLEGNGAGPSLTYEWLQEVPVPIAPGQSIAFPDTAIGDTSNSTIRIRNAGNAEGRINAIAISGAGYELADTPFLPVSMPAGGSVSLRISFRPAQPGPSAGRLRVDNDAFELSGNGLGPLLRYSYSSGSEPIQVMNNGLVVLPPVSLGRSSSAIFEIANSGTAPARIADISVRDADGRFTLAEVPALPATLPPGEGLSFTILFKPKTSGSSSATLAIGAQAFTLSGTGNPPAALPEYSFDGPRGTQDPLQQPSVRLSLSSEYPLNVAGTLTLSFSSEVFSDDSTVQFATGGRTASFTIPAGSTRAVFANNTPEIRLQTGSVAGTIMITPSFALEGGINLPAPSVPALSFVVPKMAPRIVSAVTEGKTATGFTLAVTAYATSRSVSRIELQVEPMPGESLSNTRLVIEAEPFFNSWYQSAQSQQFGSLFAVSIPVTLQGTAKSGANLVDAIRSVSITISNSQGTSPSRSVELR